MYIDHRAALRIARVIEQIDIPTLLMDEQGNVLIPEGDPRHLTLPDAVKQNPAEPLLYGGVTLIGARGERGTFERDGLFLCLNGDGSDVRNCAILLSELISTMLRVDIGHIDRAQALRMILRGEVDIGDIETLAAAHEIPMEAPRCVIYIVSRDTDTEVLAATIGALLNRDKDIFTDIGRHALAVVKTIEGADDLDAPIRGARRLAEAFEDAEISVRIGVSEARMELDELCDAYAEARDAITIGAQYQSGERVFEFRRLLLERFLGTVEPATGAMFGATIFNARTSRLFGDEMVHTIEVFFDNNLNLSEAARKLYIHRNTLVYRLEKVQRLTGFDLRQFDDAATFKLMMLLAKSGAQKPRL